MTEIDGLDDYFDMASYRVEINEGFIRQVIDEAARVYSIRAMDAAHITAAKVAHCDEFITTEKPTKPLFKVRGIRVLHFPT